MTEESSRLVSKTGGGLNKACDKLTSSITVCPAVEVRLGWLVREICWKYPIYHEGTVFVGSIFTSDDETSE